jgi:hypothetical protein
MAGVQHPEGRTPPLARFSPAGGASADAAEPRSCRDRQASRVELYLCVGIVRRIRNPIRHLRPCETRDTRKPATSERRAHGRPDWRFVARFVTKASAMASNDTMRNAQALLEMYCRLAFNARFNDFNTHEQGRRTKPVPLEARRGPVDYDPPAFLPPQTRRGEGTLAAAACCQ